MSVILVSPRFCQAPAGQWLSTAVHKNLVMLHSVDSSKWQGCLDCCPSARTKHSQYWAAREDCLLHSSFSAFTSGRCAAWLEDDSYLLLSPTSFSFTYEESHVQDDGPQWPLRLSESTPLWRHLQDRLKGVTSLLRVLFRLLLRNYSLSLSVWLLCSLQGKQMPCYEQPMERLI